MRKKSCRFCYEECSNNFQSPSLHFLAFPSIVSKKKKKMLVKRSKLNLRTFSRVKVGGYCAQIEGFFRPCPRHDIPCRKRLVTLNLPPTKLPIDGKKG